MKIGKLINIINHYFEEYGDKNIIDNYYIDHDLQVRVKKIMSNQGKIYIFIDTEPQELEHTIEDEYGEPTNLWYAVFEELEEILKLVNIDIYKYDIRMFLNSLPIGSQEDLETFPFLEENVTKKVKIRTFSENVKTEELKWHFDDEDRVVIPQHKNNWYFQMDNKLPIKLIEGKEYFVPKGVYHRLIKGDGDLKVKIHLK
jgi:hypothetical protein